MKDQAHQAEEVSRKNLAEDTSAESGKGRAKHREQFAGWLGDSPGVRILSFASQAAAVVSIIVAGITYIAEGEQREQEKNFQAWQAINTAQGQGGSGGRIEALQDLNEGEQSLVGLTVPYAFLQEIKLKEAELDYANFTRATLTGAELQDASMKYAVLQEANLGISASDAISDANLKEALLQNADARSANLSNVNLQGAKLNNADLSYAVLDEAQLQGADLKGASLEEASLFGANLQGADFQNAFLTNADLRGADLRGAKHLTQYQIDDSRSGDDETQLPAGLHESSQWYTGPLDELGPLSPGKYTVRGFDAPMSFRLGEDWINGTYETDTTIELDRQDTDDNLGIFFTAPQQVYDPQNLSTARIQSVPEDMVAWLQHHPYLNAETETNEVNIGGVDGIQFDVQIPAMPQDYPSALCEAPCLPIIVDETDKTALRLYEGGYRVTVLTVNGQKVVIFVDLEERTPKKAAEVLKTIEWEGVATSVSTAAQGNVGSRSQERELIQGSNAADLEAAAVEAVSEYYRAAGSEDWAYTYKNLDSETQSMFTQKEWVNKNQWFADNSPVTYHILSVDVNSASQEPVAEVKLELAFENDSTQTRNTQFVLEERMWKHRFTEDEIALFRPDDSYEEFVDAKR